MVKCLRPEDTETLRLAKFILSVETVSSKEELSFAKETLTESHIKVVLHQSSIFLGSYSYISANSGSVIKLKSQQALKDEVCCIRMFVKMYKNCMSFLI